MLSGGLLLSGIWLAAILRSDYPLKDTSLLFLMQVILSFSGLAVLIFGFPIGNTSPPLGYRQIFAIHVLLYYGVSNIVPAVLPELRPELLVLMIGRIPLSAPFDYFVGSMAALLFLAGIVIGNAVAHSTVCKQVAPVSRPGGDYRLLTLPGFEISWIVCCSLTALVVAGTLLYALQWGNVTLDAESSLVSLPIWEQLFFYGLIPFLPVAPLLGANAYLRADTPKAKKYAYRLMIVSGAIILLALAGWGMRSTAIVAFLMPVGLLVMNGVVRFRQAILPGLAMMIVIYALVTAVRISSLADMLGEAGVGNVDLSDLLSATGPLESEGTILGGAFGDMSYRAAGLEGVAAIVKAQGQGFDYKWGRVTMSGFLQGLPVSMRPPDVPGRVKTAPSHYGLFQAGDWVTTLLAESVLDFGPILLFLSAILTGFSITLIDHLFLRVAQKPLFEGLLILRIPFLLFPLYVGGSLADMTLVLWKATAGYALFFMLVGGVVNMKVRCFRGYQQYESMMGE